MSELEDLSTTALLDQIGSGNQTALDELYGRYCARLKRWARGRLAPRARSLLDTDEIVQRTLRRTLRDVGASPPEARGKFLGHVRRAIDDGIVHGLRQEKAIGGEPAIADDAYEAAFRLLDSHDQVAIAARLEEGLSYDEIARELGKGSAEEARAVVSEAILRLAQAMRHAGNR